MKMKRVIPILLAFALVLSLLPSVRLTAAAYTNTAAALPTEERSDDTLPTEYYGFCGDDAFGILIDGVLTISGTGSISHFYLEQNSVFSALTEKVIIEEGITSISPLAFSDFYNLTEISIPSSVVTIQPLTFLFAPLSEIKVDAANPCYADVDGILFNKAKTELLLFPPARTGSYRIPDGIESLASMAFSCTALTDVTIPASTTQIEAGAFAGYPSLLRSIYVESGNTVYENDANGILYAKGKKELIACPGAFAGELSISSSVTKIWDSAFAGCAELRGVTIPDSVTAIGGYTFENCRSLESIEIPEKVSDIGIYAFYDCERLEKVTFPNALTAIGDSAFSGTALKTVTIPAAVNSIGDHAFSCDALTDVYFLGDTPKLGEEVFYTYVEDVGYAPNPELTLYYLDGRKGWTTPTWNGYPTAVHAHAYDNSGRCDACGYAPSDAFEDIPDNAWYVSAVNYAVANGLMNGMGNGEFQPDEPTTRAMVVTILYRLSGSSSKYENKFTDVLNNNWYTDAISWAAYYGIVNGMTATTFEPETSMTREMLAVILYRYTTKKTDADTTEKADLSVFPDESSVSPWAKEAMQWAVANGIVNGVGDGKATYLQPLGNATRAQVAAIFQRYIKNVLNK